MPPVSGVDLVSGALQSSLAGAQKAYHFLPSSSSLKGLHLRNHKRLLKLKNNLILGSSVNHTLLDNWKNVINDVEFSSATKARNTLSEELAGKYLCLNPQYGTSNSKDITSVVVETNNQNGYSILKSDDSLSKQVVESSTILNIAHPFELLSKLKSAKRKKKLKRLEKLRLKQQVNESSESLLLPSCSTDKVKSSPAQNENNNNNGVVVVNGKSPVKKSSETSPLVKKSVCNKQIILKKMKDLSPKGNATTTSQNSSRLPEPKYVLYPREKVRPGWRQKLPPGRGLMNLGNTCYMNASLQALFHVPSFVNWLLEDSEDHRQRCRAIGSGLQSCILCAMYHTLRELLDRQSSSFKPIHIHQKLKSICKHFMFTRQEDAHEFLRYLLEAMERAYLSAISALRLDNRSKETTPLGQIFGGYLRTEVVCQRCNFVSTTFQPMAELQLDIRHFSSIEDAIENHFMKERLDNNDYKCERCKTISQATKQFSLEVPPNVLCLQLKRFTLFGSKINKPVQCNRVLNLSKYLHKSKFQENERPEMKYRLIAIVNHLGPTPHCGHYTAQAEASNGQFYNFDDSCVQMMSTEKAVNSTNAYIIIYERVARNFPNHPSSQPQSTPSSYKSSNNTTNGSTNPNTTTSKPSTVFPSSVINGSSSGLNSNRLFSTPGSSNPPKISIPFLKSTNNGSALSKAINGASNNNNTNHGSKLVNSSSVKNSLPNGISSSSKYGANTTNNSDDVPKKINIHISGASLTNSSKLFPPAKSQTSSSTIVNGTSPTKSNGEKQFRLVPYDPDDKDNNSSESSSETEKGSNGKERVRPKSPEKSSFPTKKFKSCSPDKHSSGSHHSSYHHRKSYHHHHHSSRDEHRHSRPRDNNNSKRRSTSSSSSLSDDNDERPLISKKDSKSSSKFNGVYNNHNNNNGTNGKDRKYESAGKRELNGNVSSATTNGMTNGNGRTRSLSEERDQCLRKNRNPSPVRNGSKSPLLKEKSKFDVKAIVDREKNVSAWDGQQSTLSKVLALEERKLSFKSKEDLEDEEMDRGRTKKLKSRSHTKSPDEFHRNKFQDYEETRRSVSEATKKLQTSHHNSHPESSDHSSDKTIRMNGNDSHSSRSLGSSADFHSRNGHSSGPFSSYSNGKGSAHSSGSSFHRHHNHNGSHFRNNRFKPYNSHHYGGNNRRPFKGGVNNKFFYSKHKSKYSSF